MEHLTFIFVCVLVPLANAWVELKTNYAPPGTPNSQPFTAHEAAQRGWKTLGTDGCKSEGAIWPGTRMIPDIKLPDMVVIYDVDGKFAGMQSGMPASEFEGGACPPVPWYISTTVKNMEYCLATMYFMDPATICSSGKKEDRMFFQEGATYMDKDKLVAIPRTWNDAQTDYWKSHFFFLGMGHHVLPSMPEPENCLMMRPYQILYARKGSECAVTGMVWQHLQTNTLEHDNWEKTPTAGMKMIIRDPSNCFSTIVARKKLTTMHTFFGGSTAYCMDSLYSRLENWFLDNLLV